MGRAPFSTQVGGNPVFRGSVQTTDATVTTLSSISVEDGKTTHIEATVSARKTDGTAGATYSLHSSFRRTGGTTTQIGGITTVSHIAEDDSSWNATTDVSGSTVRIRVTGAAATIIDWTSTAVIKSTVG